MMADTNASPMLMAYIGTLTHSCNSCTAGHVSAALQSVFPQTELGTFMSLVKRDKERQLQELTMIVTGIRLFNKECGKGGEGIDDCKWQITTALKNACSTDCTSL